jgi:hypothetical protein
LAAPEGGKEPLLAQDSAFSMGSDHDVYQDSSFGIPSIYLNDWPDRYIHTNFDTAANIDPTKLLRTGFIGAASGYVLANLEKPQWVAAGSTGTASCTGDGCLIFRRKPTPKGPLAVFGYDYFADHFKGSPKLLGFDGTLPGALQPGLLGSGEEYAYEILNFADGKRNAHRIRDAVSVEYGPVALDIVVEYLRALEKIGVVEKAQ